MQRLTSACGRVLAVALLLSLATPAWADETTGTLRSANADRKEVVLKGLVKDTTYEVNKDTNVYLDGRKSKVADLREGDRTAISYDKKGERMIATEVRCLRNASETSGTVRSVTGESGVTLKGVVKDSTYSLDRDAAVYIDGKAGKISDLREGNHVIITYEKRGDNLMASEIRKTSKK